MTVTLRNATLNGICNESAIWSDGINLVLNILAIAAELVIGYIMLRYGANFVRSMALRMSYSIGVKMSYIVIVVPISGLLIILATLERLLRIKEISRPQEVQNV